MEKIRRLSDVVSYATKLHDGQKRDDGSPYISHIMSTTMIYMVGAEGEVDLDEISACLLHDSLEDCDVSPEDIEKHTNMRVLQSVKRLTQDGDRGAYLDSLKNCGKVVRRIKVADRIHNLSDCRTWKEKRIKKYLNETIRYVLPLSPGTGLEKLLIEVISWRIYKLNNYEIGVVNND